MSNLLSELDAVVACLDKQRLMLSANEPTAARHWSLQVDSLSSDLFRTHHAEIAAAVRDAARLDWLDANGFTAYRSIDPIDGLEPHCVVVSETMKPRRGNVASTIREALDAAMSAREGEG